MGSGMLVAASCAWEKEGAVGKRDDKRALLVSCWRERRGKGMAGWAESEGEKIRRFLFLFFKLIFKSIYNLNFEQIFLLQKITHHKIKCHSLNASKIVS